MFLLIIWYQHHETLKNNEHLSKNESFLKTLESHIHLPNPDDQKKFNRLIQQEAMIDPNIHKPIPLPLTDEQKTMLNALDKNDKKVQFIGLSKTGIPGELGTIVQEIRNTTHQLPTHISIADVIAFNVLKQTTTGHSDGREKNSNT